MPRNVRNAYLQKAQQNNKKKRKKQQQEEKQARNRRNERSGAAKKSGAQNNARSSAKSAVNTVKTAAKNNAKSAEKNKDKTARSSWGQVVNRTVDTQKNRDQARKDLASGVNARTVGSKNKNGKWKVNDYVSKQDGTATGKSATAYNKYKTAKENRYKAGKKTVQTKSPITIGVETVADTVKGVTEDTRYASQWYDKNEKKAQKKGMTYGDKKKFIESYVRGSASANINNYYKQNKESGKYTYTKTPTDSNEFFQNAVASAPSLAYGKTKVETGTPVYVRNKDGSLKYDKNGDPILKKDKNGNQVYEKVDTTIGNNILNARAGGFDENGRLVSQEGSLKMGSQTAGALRDAKFFGGLLQGSGYSDITKGLGQYSNAAARDLDRTTQSGAFNVGYGAGIMAQFGMSGINGMAKSLLSGGAKSVPKALAKNAGLSMALDTPLNVADAYKMSTDAKGNFNPKAFAMYMGINTLASGAMPAAFEGVAAGMTKKESKELLGLIAREESLTQAGKTLSPEEVARRDFLLGKQVKKTEAQESASAIIAGRTLDEITAKGGSDLVNVIKAKVKANPQKILGEVKLRDKNGKRTDYEIQAEDFIKVEAVRDYATKNGDFELAKKAEMKLQEMRSSLGSDIFSGGSKVEKQAVETMGQAESARTKEAVTALSESGLGEALSKEELEDYATLTTKSMAKDLAPQEVRRLQEINEKVIDTVSEKSMQAKHALENFENRNGKISGGDVSALRSAIDHFKAVGDTEAEQEARIAFEKATAEYKQSLEQVVKASRAISKSLGGDTKVVSSDEILDIIRRTDKDKYEKVKNNPTLIGGYVVKEGDQFSIYVNKESVHAMEFTLGHEVTHLFEGLGKAYDDFKSSLIDYAKKNGDWDDARQFVEEQYRDIDADIDGETLANLVGRYLCEEDDRFLRFLAGEKPTLFERLYDFLKKIVTGNNDTQLSGLEKRLEDMYASVRENKQFGEGNEALFGGKESVVETKNKDLADSLELAKADYEDAKVRFADDPDKLLEEEKKIFKRSRWFRGYDGKWRYEIDDSGMSFQRSMRITSKDTDIIKRDANGRLVADEEKAHEYQRIAEELGKKEKNGKLTKAEAKKLSQARSKWQMYLLNSDEGLPLEMVIKHKALFKMYPEMGTDIRVKVKDLGDDTAAHHGYERYTDEKGLEQRREVVALNSRLLDEDSELYFDMMGAGLDPDDVLKDSVIHELQHAIQDREGFAKGTSTNAFYDDYLYGNVYPKNMEKDGKRLFELTNEKDKLIDDIGDAWGDYGEADYFAEQYLKLKHDKESLFESKLYSGDRKQYGSYVYSKLKQDYGIKPPNNKVDSLMKKYILKDYEAAQLAERDPDKLYDRSAGEFEANISEDRRTLSSKERKNSFPIEKDNKNLNYDNILNPETLDKEFPDRRSKVAKATELLYGGLEAFEKNGALSDEETLKAFKNVMSAYELLKKGTKIMRENGGYKDLESHKSATALREKAGATRRQIFEKTGWFQGVDGKWRFEIDDFGMHLNTSVKELTRKSKDEWLPLEEVITHDELFKYYPDLRTDIKVKIINDPNVSWRGATNPYNGEIQLNTAQLFRQAELDLGRSLTRQEKAKELKGTLLHEIQHNIQKIEGFAEGSNTNLPSTDIGDLPDGLKKIFTKGKARQLRAQKMATRMQNQEDYIRLAKKFRRAAEAFDDDLIKNLGIEGVGTFREWANSDNVVGKIMDLVGNHTQLEPERMIWTDTPETLAKGFSEFKKEFRSQITPLFEKAYPECSAKLFEQYHFRLAEPMFEPRYDVFLGYAKSLGEEESREVQHNRMALTAKERRKTPPKAVDYAERRGRELLGEEPEYDFRHTDYEYTWGEHADDPYGETVETKFPNRLTKKDAQLSYGNRRKPKTRKGAEQPKTRLPKGTTAPKKPKGRAGELKEEMPSVEQALKNAKEGYISAHEIGEHAKRLGETWSSELEATNTAFKEAVKKGELGKKVARGESYEEAYKKAQEEVQKDLGKVYDRVIGRDPYIVETTQSAAEKHALLSELITRAGAGDETATMMHLKVIDKMDEAASLGGHMLQLQSYVLRNSPEGRLRWTMREINRLNKEYEKHLKGKKITLGEEWIRKIMNAESDAEIAKVMEDVGKEIWKQVPSGFFEAANQIRHFSMLFNPKTHGRNVIGNSVFLGARMASDAIEIGMTKAFGKRIESLSGVGELESLVKKLEADVKSASTPEEKQTAQTKLKLMRTTLKEAKSDSNSPMRQILASGEVDGCKDILEERFKVDYATNGGQNTGRWQEGRRSAGYLYERSGNAVKDTVAKVVNKAIDLNYNLLDREDRWFFRPAYERAYVRWCKSRGITETVNGTKMVTPDALENMTKTQRQEATAYAMQQAKIATFRDDSAVSERIIKWKQATEGKKGTGLGTVGYRTLNVGLESVLPFVKTPVNILRRGMDYSPIGLFRGVADAVLAKDPQTFMRGIHSMSTGLTGSGIFVLGMWAANHDWVTVHAGEVSGDEYYDRDMGYQDFSIKIFGHSVSLDWMAPVQFSFFQGAAVWKDLSDRGISMETALNALEAGVMPMMEMSFMSSAKDTVTSFMERAYRDGTGKEANAAQAIGRTLFGTLPQDWLSGFVPQLMNQTAGFLDDKQRDTSSTKEDELARSWEAFGRKMKNRIPWLRDDLEAKVNRKGEEVTNEGNLMLKFFNAFANPSNVKKITLDKYDQAIIDVLGDEDIDDKDKEYICLDLTGNPSLDRGEDYERMTYKEKHDYLVEKRSKQWGYWKEAVDSKSFKDMTMQMRADEISDYHFVSTVEADLKVYKAQYAKDKIVAKGDTEADLWKNMKYYGGNARDFVDSYVAIEKTRARAHDSNYHTDALAIQAMDTSDRKKQIIGRTYDIYGDKIETANNFLKEFKNKSKGVAEYTDAICSGVSECTKNNVSTSQMNMSIALAGVDGGVKERTYRARGYTWNPAQAGSGLRKYGYTYDSLAKMKSDALMKYDEDNNNKLKKGDVVAYIESLGIEDNDEKACLFEYLKPSSKTHNPYGVIKDHLEWNSEPDVEGSGGKGWGRRRGRRGRGGGGGGSGGGAEWYAWLKAQGLAQASKAGGGSRSGGSRTGSTGSRTGSSPIRTKDNTSKSALNEAYRAKLRKNIKATRKPN